MVVFFWNPLNPGGDVYPRSGVPRYCGFLDSFQPLYSWEKRKDDALMLLVRFASLGVYGRMEPRSPMKKGDFINYSGQIIATSAEVTPNDGLIGIVPQNTLNSGLGILVICPDYPGLIGIVKHQLKGLWKITG